MRALIISLLLLLASLGAGAAWLVHQGAFAVKAETRVAAAQDQTSVAKLETQGAKLSVGRVKATLATQADAAALAAKYRAEAQAAGDADAPLDADRAQRLRAADEQLCRLRPTLDGCPSN